MRHQLPRILLVSALVGALSLGAAWAGTVLSPRPNGPDLNELPAQAGGPFRTEAAIELPGLDGGELLVGAAKVNIYPQPNAANGEVWIRDRARCEALTPEGAQYIPGQAADTRTLWPENPGCIYTGGYGIGPMNAVTDFDSEYGLWTRTFAVSNGEKTVVLNILDATYWEGRYNQMCPDCGALDLSESLSAELAEYGVEQAGMYFASTHSHTAPDFIGGWGGVPPWYMKQVAEAIRTSVREAVTNMVPGKVEAGEILARDYNRDRRKTYYSAQEAGMSWLRAVDRDGDTVATLGAYAAHPVTISTNGIAHADWVALFEKRVEDRFGGVGLHFMTGLGQMTSRGGTGIGTALANLIPDVGKGAPVAGDANGTVAVRSAKTEWDHPITNVPLAGLGGLGLFDRPFGGPAAVDVGRSSVRRCRSAAPVSVRTQVNASRVGNLMFSGAPGETFANLTNTLKEHRQNTVTFPLALVNDGLGYINQSFEAFEESRTGAGFGGTEATEYEDAYSLDRCFGDKVLGETLSLFDAIWVS